MKKKQKLHITQFNPLKKDLKDKDVSKKKGLFIVIEGIDRCGKNTHQQLLNKHIDESVTMGFPNPISNTWPLIDLYLNGGLEISPKEAHLLFSLNRYETRDWIEETLRAGNTIICSRYIYSGIAYSMANGLDYEWCKTTDALTKESGDYGLPTPDVTFFIDTDPTTCSKRKGYGNQITEKIEYQKNVRGKFIDILKDNKNCITIDGNRGEKQIHNEILNHVMKIMNDKKVLNVKINANV